MTTVFEWDPAKAASNLRKHRISFEVAQRAFLDPLAWTQEDRFEHGEQRLRLLGMVDGSLLLVVAHTAREEGDLEIIRIISARAAEPKERRRYEDAIS